MDIKKVSSDFQFHTSNISHVKIDNNMLSVSENPNISRSFDVNYEISKIAEIETRRYATISLLFDINVTDSDNNLLSFKINIEGIFSVSSEIDESSFIEMLELNGLTALYGVSRGHISTISSTITDVEKITLPLINIRRLVELKHNKK